MAVHAQHKEGKARGEIDEMTPADLVKNQQSACCFNRLLSKAAIRAGGPIQTDWPRSGTNKSAVNGLLRVLLFGRKRWGSAWAVPVGLPGCLARL